MQLYIKNISKTFKNIDGNVTILNNISFDIKTGEIITIYGHSGVGKSTLLKRKIGTRNKTQTKVNFKIKLITFLPELVFLVNCIYRWLKSN